VAGKRSYIIVAYQRLLLGYGVEDGWGIDDIPYGECGFLPAMEIEKGESRGIPQHSCLLLDTG
jgi:hypothetical protein